MSFAFDPVTGLLNTTSFPTLPASETAARQQFMTILYQLRDFINKHGVVAVDTGSANALVVTIPPTIADVSDTVLIVKANANNTGACTINVNALGAVDIKKDGTTDLVLGDIVEDSYAYLIYDGTNYQLLTARVDLSDLQNTDNVLLYL